MIQIFKEISENVILVNHNIAWYANNFQNLIKYVNVIVTDVSKFSTKLYLLENNFKTLQNLSNFLSFLFKLEKL